MNRRDILRLIGLTAMATALPAPIFLDLEEMAPAVATYPAAIDDIFGMYARVLESGFIPDRMLMRLDDFVALGGDLSKVTILAE